MIFKDGKTFSAYVRSKLHSGYITPTFTDMVRPKIFYYSFNRKLK